MVSVGVDVSVVDRLKQDIEAQVGALNVECGARVLYCGLDTLALSYEGAGVREDVREAMPVSVGRFVTAAGRDWRVQRAGGFWGWSLHCPEVAHVSLSARVPEVGRSVMSLMVYLYAPFLHSVGPQAAVAFARRVARELMAGGAWSKELVNRADFFADMGCVVDPFPLGEVQKRQFLTRARYRPEYAETVAPVSLSADGYQAPEGPFEEADAKGWTVGSVFTGFEFGRGDVRARIYRKEVELRAKGSTYFFDLWGVPEGDLSAAGLDSVWRVEFQVRRSALDELGVGNFESLMAKRSGLWRYLSEAWLRQVAGADQNKARRPETAFWSQVQGAADALRERCNARPAEVSAGRRAVRVRRRVWKRAQLAAQQVGVLLTQAALDECYTLAEILGLVERSLMGRFGDEYEVQSEVLGRRLFMGAYAAAGG